VEAIWFSEASRDLGTLGQVESVEATDDETLPGTVVRFADAVDGQYETLSVRNGFMVTALRVTDISTGEYVNEIIECSLAAWSALFPISLRDMAESTFAELSFKLILTRQVK